MSSHKKKNNERRLHSMTYNVVFDYDGIPLCKICANPIRDNQRTNIEHWIPRSRNSDRITASLNNKWLVHSVCNCVKGNCTPEEWLRVREQRIVNALSRWKLKYKDRLILEHAYRSIIKNR